MRILSFLFLLVISLYAKERIISLSPSITEILFALERGEEVVGTSAFSLYPEEAQDILIVSGHNNPNIEKIIALKPTLVLGQSYHQDTFAKLEKFNIKTSALRFKTIDDIKNSIQTIAKLLDADDKKLIHAINNALSSMPKNKDPHSVLIVYGLHEDLRRGIYIAGKDVFFDDIIMACGNTNAFTSNVTAQPVLSYENVIALSPDQIIILHSHATEKNIDIEKALQSWRALPTKASKNNRISIVDEEYLHIPSHRVALTIERLCREMKY
ncbi:MAG: helical backbone metal receptor [Sulfurimonadaceae bacterium]|jgi:iron complex transport system substrate-binding protein|nr:helical backbone metal receptor [Sulfurimonadaceae bacterium]